MYQGQLIKHGFTQWPCVFTRFLHSQKTRESVAARNGFFNKIKLCSLGSTFEIIKLTIFKCSQHVLYNIGFLVHIINSFDLVIAMIFWKLQPRKKGNRKLSQLQSLSLAWCPQVSSNFLTQRESEAERASTAVALALAASASHTLPSAYSTSRSWASESICKLSYF